MPHTTHLVHQLRICPGQHLGPSGHYACHLIGLLWQRPQLTNTYDTTHLVHQLCINDIWHNALAHLGFSYHLKLRNTNAETHLVHQLHIVYVQDDALAHLAAMHGHLIGSTLAQGHN